MLFFYNISQKTNRGGKVWKQTLEKAENLVEISVGGRSKGLEAVATVSDTVRVSGVLQKPNEITAV